jgi:hypothetical protein
MRRAGIDGLSKIIARKSAERVLAHLESAEHFDNRNTA